MSGPDDTLVIVPLKAFSSAKSRLASVRTPSEREALARSLASGVLDALSGRRVIVVRGSDDVELDAWAAERGVATVVAPPGLDQAAFTGRENARERQIGRIVVCHADLSRPSDLSVVLDRPGSFVVPDRHLDGTNLLALPSDSDFEFAYGPGSLKRHLDEAVRCGIDLTIIEDTDLGIDIDEPADLALHLQQDFGDQSNNE